VNRGVSISEGTERLTVALVKFSAGARTKWHTHSFEQGLIIVEGVGIVATEETEHVVEPGDVVIVTNGEKHWHGATSHTHMSHYSIGAPGGVTTELEPVDQIRTPDE
jgi:quercetin dioxygenase-like cupin family protein